MNEQFWTPVKLSLEIASVAVIIVFILGITLAMWMTRFRVRGKVIIETILLLPLVLPPTVVGFLLIVIFGNQSPVGILFQKIFHQSIMFTWWAALISATIVAFPLMYQSAKTGFQIVDLDIEDAARIDGANDWKVFLYITIPLSLKSIISGFILAFARALGEFGATFMFAGNLPGKTQTIPIAVYIALDSGNMDLAWILVISIIFISFVMLILTTLIK
ncbi:molybdate ABC transporter permease subunit [Bacillus sp. 1NLA3E]|uniref:molybdate ABC transporter permease subunit n=1 Tax=Bacillus sp. 1NLA3E TaxID=666686 RepID=UPI0005A2D734|nr:molybdate ABC transporter permease subunit [Bacillus sp. 1NLA3E]